MADLSREGHRARMRSLYLSNSMENASDHNLLELFLSIIIPRKDVKQVSYNLINTFGSLENIVDADVSDLMSVDGVGESTAIAIKLIKDITRRINMNKCSNLRKINSTAEAFAFCSNLLTDEIVERIGIITLSNDGSIINYHLLQRGAVNSVSSDLKTYARFVTADNAAGIILFHNHPRGDSSPSVNDINYTIELKAFLRRMDVNLIDHIIVGKEDCTSLKQKSEINSIFD